MVRLKLDGPWITRTFEGPDPLYRYGVHEARCVKPVRLIVRHWAGEYKRGIEYTRPFDLRHFRCRERQLLRLQFAGTRRHETIWSGMGDLRVFVRR